MKQLNLEVMGLLLISGQTLADRPAVSPPLIGYTELQTNLPAHVRTMRAVVVRADGSGRTRTADELADEPDAWTQFAGWSPGGRQAIVSRGWQHLENAKWEDDHKAFRMEWIEIAISTPNESFSFELGSSCGSARRSRSP